MKKYFENVLIPLINSPGIFNILYVGDGIGGVFISCSQKLIINKCIFIKNSNKYSGVGHLLPHPEFISSTILIENNIFRLNEAGNLAGVFFISSNFLQINCIIRNNLFIENSAKSKKINVIYLLLIKWEAH